MAEFLRLENINKAYGSFLANENINLSIEEGTIHALVGENGAGKSTLMNILAGVIQPTSGNIILKGEPIHLKNANDATKHKIGMVQQEFMLFEDLSVVDNIIMGHEDVSNFDLLNLEKSKNKIREICKKYSFDIPLDRKVSSLPIATQQQVEIVKVLYKDADIIILDEPTAVLTPQGIEGLFKAMRFLVNNGKTIIFITHKLKEVLAVTDNITVLKNGKVVDTIKTSSTNERQLAELMVGREVFLNITRKLSTSNEKVLECKELIINDNKQQTVINKISFDVKKSEVLGFVGVAGNGQIELIESLFGLRKISSGSILYKSNEIKDFSPKSCRLQKIGYVPQDRREIGSSIMSSLVDNTIMGKHLTSFSHRGIINHKDTENYTKEITKRFSVKANSIKSKGSELSGGNLQKLIVGREFSQDADLLIIEDPTRGIDIGSMEFIWGEIVDLVENKSKSVILVSYDLNEAMSLSDRILVLHKGEIVKEFKRDEFDEKEIGYYMLGGKKNEETSN